MVKKQKFQVRGKQQTGSPDEQLSVRPSLGVLNVPMGPGMEPDSSKAINR